MRVLGCLPPAGGGLEELRKAGQEGRFINFYLTRYCRAFEEIRYFSYAQERWPGGAIPAEVERAVRVFSNIRGRGPKRFGLLMPWDHREAFRGVGVFRVFHATGVVPAVLAKLRDRTPFVTTFGYRYSAQARDDGKTVLKVAQYRFTEQLSFRFADKIIVTTPELEALVGKTVPGNRIHRIPNGTDTALFCPAVDGEPASRSAIFVGRLSPEKRLDTILDALERLKAQGHSLPLEIIGDGELRASLEARVRDQGLDVQFAGVIPNEALPAHLQRHSVFLLASPREGNPKALIEAMSCGLTPVVSDCEGNRGLVEEGVQGLLFPVGDSGALAANLLRVTGDLALARRLGAAAREKIVNELDIRLLVERETDLLVHLAETRKR